MLIVFVSLGRRDKIYTLIQNNASYKCASELWHMDILGEAELGTNPIPKDLESTAMK